MKTLAYLDCPTGISGDMCLGALIHAGVPLDYLKEQLAKLGMEGEFQLRAETVRRNQQVATKIHVDLLQDLLVEKQSVEQQSVEQQSVEQPHRSHSQSHLHSNRKLPEIEAMIQQADLPRQATQWSLAVFRKLALAEASVHGIAPEQVHFHEVGAADAIADIVGTCLGLDWLKIDRLVCSPLPTGSGTVRCEHGLLPVPVPAVLAMMATDNVPVYSNQIEKELVTPTGCAIATTLAESFGPPPHFTLQKIGLGAGGRDLPIPNILRLWVGTVAEEHTHQNHAHQTHTHPGHTHQGHTHPGPIHQNHAHKDHTRHTQTNHEKPGQEDLTAPPASTETIVELQTQIDDCSPQAIGFVFERLFSVGALDVFTQSAAMKKNRLGTLLTVICPVDKVADCETVLFRQTTTLGIRQTHQRRTALARKIVTVSTTYGEIAVKLGLTSGKVVNIQPEYEDVARGARSYNLPWKEVHQAVMQAAVDQLSSTPAYSG